MSESKRTEKALRKNKTKILTRNRANGIFVSPCAGRRLRRRPKKTPYRRKKKFFLCWQPEGRKPRRAAIASRNCIFATRLQITLKTPHAISGWTACGPTQSCRRMTIITIRTFWSIMPLFFRIFISAKFFFTGHCERFNSFDWLEKQVMANWMCVWSFHIRFPRSILSRWLSLFADGPGKMSRRGFSKTYIRQP